MGVCRVKNKQAKMSFRVYVLFKVSLILSQFLFALNSDVFIGGFITWKITLTSISTGGGPLRNGHGNPKRAW